MTSTPRPVWGAAAALLLTCAVLAIGVWSGGCADYVGIPGECWAAPSLGWPGAILTAAVCATGAALCIRRAVRRRPAPERDAHAPGAEGSGPDDAPLSRR